MGHRGPRRAAGTVLPSLRDRSEGRAAPSGACVQQLHVVGFTTDHEGLIFSVRKGSKSGGYVVQLDDRLLTSIEEARRERDGDEGDGEGRGGRHGSRPQSGLSPREIQARLRAGNTITNVAAEAGVGEEWVARFAAPILAEQGQVVDRARQLYFSKARLGPSGQPLGLSVRWNLADKGVRMLEAVFDAAWSAYSLHGATWMVRFHYVSRQKSQTAEWELDLREGELISRNRLASELGYIEPGRRRRPPVLEPPSAPREPAPRAAVEPKPSPPRVAKPAKSARPAAKKASKKAPKKAVRKAGSGTKSRAAKRAPAAKAGRPAPKKKAKKAKKKASSRAPGKRPGTAPSRASGKQRPSPTGRAVSAAAAVPSKRLGGARLAPAAVPRASHLARPPSPMLGVNRPPPTPNPVYRPRVPTRPTTPAQRAVPVPPPSESPPPILPASLASTPPVRIVAPVAEPVDQPERRDALGETDEGAGRPGAEQRLARRLAARRAREQAAAGPTPDDDSRDVVWHGPGSGEPAPSVRIRADLAAAASTRPAVAPEVRPGRRRRPSGDDGRRARPLRPR